MDSLACTVLIATYNRCETLLKCLDHLEAQDIGPEALQVIVVDDGSTDGTLAALGVFPRRFGDYTVLSQDNSGPSIARQLGLAHAKAPITLFINDDTILERWTVRTHLEAHERHPRSMILGTFDFVAEYADEPLSRMLTETPHLFSYPLMEDGDELRADLAATCNLSAPTDVSKRVGFDSRFFIYAEDVDFALGLQDEGHQLRYCADAVGYHDHLLTVESIRKSSRVRGFGAARLALKRGTHVALLPLVRGAILDSAGLQRLHDQAAETLETELATCDPSSTLR